MHFKGLLDYILAAFCYFAINFIVFHGGLYEYLCKPESYAGNVYSRLRVLKETEQRANGRVIAFIGDSITEEGIDASQISNEIGKTAVNLALPGASLLDISLFLRAVDPNRDRFEAIVLTIIPQNMRTHADEDGIQTLLPVASIPLMLEYLSTRKGGWRYLQDYYAAFDRIFGFRRDLRDLILNPDRIANLVEARQQQLEKVRSYQGQSYDVCEVKIDPSNRKILSWGEVRDPELRRLTRHNLNRIAKLNHKPEASRMIGPLSTIARHYENSGTKIVVISVPFGPGNHVNTQAPVMQRYLAGLQEMHGSYRIEHWTAFDLKFFHDCLNFFDYRHLNHRGRKIFSSWISREWKY